MFPILRRFVLTTALLLLISLQAWDAPLFAQSRSSSPSPSGSRKIGMYFGAGGEDPKSLTTIFDDGMELIGKFFRDSSYEFRPNFFFDGGHPKSNARAKSVLGWSPKSIRIKNFLPRIEALRVEAGRRGPRRKVHAGDQVLIVIDTHGWSRSESGTSQSHHIATRGEEEPFDIDGLVPLRDAFEKAGARVAILDLSCYSGSTQELATENTCVISGTGSGMSAYPQFGNAMLAALQPGISLEEAYLRARRGMKSANEWPEISTSIGVALSTYFSPLDTFASTKDDWIEEELDSLRACRLGNENYLGPLRTLEKELQALDPSTKQLVDMISKVRNQTDASPGRRPADERSAFEIPRVDPAPALMALSELRNQIEEYQQMLRSVAVIYKRIEDLKKQSVKLPTGRKVSKFDLVLTDYLGALKWAKSRRESAALGALSIESETFLRDLEVKRQAQRQSVEIEELRADLKRADAELSKATLTADRIGAQERIIYDWVYTTHRTANPKEGGPCADFIL